MQAEPVSTQIRPRPERLQTALALFISASLIVVGTWASYWAENRNDQYQSIAFSQCVADGRPLYRDCWENKPPGVAWINALGIAVWPDGQFGAWLLPGFFAGASLLVFWRCARAIAGSQAARYALVLASIVATLRLYDAASITLDFYAFTLELIAASLMTVALTASGRWKAILAGAAAGVAFAAATCVKQVSFAGLAATALVLGVLLIRRHPLWRAWLLAAGSAGFAFLCGLCVVGVILAREGTLGEAWHAVFEFNTRFLPEGLFASLPNVWPRLRRDLSPLELPIWLSLVGLVGVFSCGVPRLSRPWAAAWGLWILIAAWFAIHGPSGSLRYWQAVWAPLLWLGVAGLEALSLAYRRVEGPARRTLGVVYLTILLMLLAPLAFQYRLGIASAYVEYTESPNERQRLTEIGRKIAELVPAGEHIYIWSYDIGPYLYADRRPAARFTHPWSPESMRDILEAVEAGRAYAILIPPRPGTFFSRWCDEECETRLQKVLQEYHSGGEIGNYTVWLRKSPAVGGP